MSDATCLGGAVDTDYRPAKLTVKIYLRFWRILGKLTGMAQGATQLCRRDLFFALNGYDETLFMGEDVDFHWRLKRIAKRQKASVVSIEDLRVVPSTRRFDQWPLWRTLVWTNPLRSEEHTSELQSLTNLVCRLLLEKKKKKTRANELTC